MPDNLSQERAETILGFWFEEVDHARWSVSTPAFDREVHERFGERLEQAKRGKLDVWAGTPRGRLALIILLDQFSRNIHRDTPAAFEADPQALALALEGIECGDDRALSLEERSFFYLPLRHSEDRAMQRFGLLKTRELNAEGYATDKYALKHLEQIERFGRFPHRNSVLGRENTPEEAAFLATGKAGF